MNKVLFTKADATVKLNGFMRIINSDGDIEKEIDLSQFGTLKSSMDSADIIYYDDDSYYISFRVEIKDE